MSRLTEIMETIRKVQGNIMAIDALIDAYRRENENSSSKICRYARTIEGAEKDKRYGLSHECREAICKEVKAVSKRNKSIKEYECRKAYEQKKLALLEADANQIRKERRERRKKRALRRSGDNRLRTQIRPISPGTK